jgi:hypothetical protein
MCPNCFEKEFKYIDQNSSLFISYKYETQELKKLFGRVKKRMDIEIGNSDCSGEIEDEFQISLAKFNKDTRFNAKIKCDFLQRNKNDEKLTVFLNKKNPIFEKIAAKKILEHIQNNFDILSNYQKPIHNKFTEQLDSIGNKNLVDLLKGRKKDLAQKQHDKSNFAEDENAKEINLKVEENKVFKIKAEDDNIDNKNCKCYAVGQSDSLLEFYEKTNLKLIEGSLEDANLGSVCNKFFKGKNNLIYSSHYGINESLNKGSF